MHALQAIGSVDALRKWYARLPAAVRAPISRLYWEARLRSIAIAPMPELAEQAPVAHAEPHLALGVRVHGYLSGEFGLGEAARLYAGALRAAGARVAVHDLDIELPHTRRRFAWTDDRLDGSGPVVDLVVVNPDYLDQALPLVGDGRPRRPRIGCWFWELDAVPASWRHAARHLDAILVASEFTRDVLQPVVDIPVIAVPLPVARPAMAGATRKAFGIPENVYTFLVSFDFNSFPARKNPLGAIEAFQTAFPSRDRRAALFIKTTNGRRHQPLLAELHERVAGDDRIMLRDGNLPAAGMRALQACADAYVSLHRAEGFGLGMAEAMALGKPVVATGWSGNMEFTTADACHLVDYRLVDVRPGEYLDCPGASWAEPDVGQAAVHMRALVDDPVAGRALGARAAQRIAERLGPTQVGERLAAALSCIATGSNPAASTVGEGLA